MSWNFRKVGIASQVAALKAAIQAEHAPQSVKDELCLRVDQVVHYVLSDKADKTAVVVITFGHIGDTPELLFRGTSDVKLDVSTAPLIDTPLAE